MREFSSSSHRCLYVEGDDDRVRYVMLAVIALALLAAGAAYESRGPSGTQVPAIELRPTEKNERKPTKRPDPAPERKKSAGTGSGTESGGGGAAPAPAPAPAPAGEDDDGDDDRWEDDGDDDGGDD